MSGSYARLATGDIVGRTLGDPQWALVNDVHAGMLAHPTRVIVIRPLDADSRYLLAYLQSNMARNQLTAAAEGQTVPRVTATALRKLLVPVVKVPAHALSQADPVSELRQVVEGLVEQLEDRYRSAFDEPHPRAITETLSTRRRKRSWRASC